MSFTGVGGWEYFTFESLNLHTPSLKNWVEHVHFIKKSSIWIKTEGYIIPIESQWDRKGLGKLIQSQRGAWNGPRSPRIWTTYCTFVHAYTLRQRCRRSTHRPSAKENFPRSEKKIIVLPRAQVLNQKEAETPWKEGGTGTFFVCLGCCLQIWWEGVENKRRRRVEIWLKQNNWKLNFTRFLDREESLFSSRSLTYTTPTQTQLWDTVLKTLTCAHLLTYLLTHSLTHVQA